MNTEAVEHLLDNRWFRRLLWMVGGCLWVMHLCQLGETKAAPSGSLEMELQGTVIDAHRKVAIINGQPIARGEVLTTGQGEFRVRSLEPRRAILERGQERITLEMPTPGNAPRQLMHGGNQP